MIELEQIKDYLWITGTGDDTRLQLILDSVNSLVVSVIWNYEEWEKTIQVKNKVIKDNKIGLLHVNPIKITNINWNDFNLKLKWFDYIILDNWEVIIPNLCSYISNDFWIFEVKYTAWYTNEGIPNDLIGIVANYVWYLYSQDLWKDVVREKTGPREVQYWVNDWIFSGWIPLNGSKSNFLKSLSKYVPLHLRIWG